MDAKQKELEKMVRYFRSTLADLYTQRTRNDLIFTFSPLGDEIKNIKKIEVIVTDQSNKTLNYTYFNDPLQAE